MIHFNDIVEILDLADFDIGVMVGVVADDRRRVDGAFVDSNLLRNTNAPEEQKLVTVILLSQNSPDLSLRAFRSCLHFGLEVVHGSFTSGRRMTTQMSEA